MKKFLIILSVLTVIGFVAWYFLQNRQGDGDSPAGTSGGTGSSGSNDNFPLKRGSRGDNVVRLQRHLNERINHASTVMAPVLSEPYALLSVDGDFGSKTEKEVETYYGVREVSHELFISKNM